MNREALHHQQGCEWCASPIPEGRRRDARFCSDNCRKRACDDSHRAACADCGRPMSTRTGWSRGDRPLERCVGCHRKGEAATHRARLENVAEMYREGKTYAQIGEALGYGPCSRPPEVAEAFKVGVLTDADRRYPKQRVENMRNGRWGRAVSPSNSELERSDA